MDGAREPVGRELASAAGAVAGIALLGAGGAVALEGLRPYMLQLLVVSGLAITNAPHLDAAVFADHARAMLENAH
jgi:hypothetical protein